MGLAETLVAVALLGTAVVSLLMSLSTGSLAVGATRESIVGESIAQSQVAYTKAYPFVSGTTAYPGADVYDATYNPHPIVLPDGYAVVVTASPTQDVDGNIQRIKVTVYKDGEDRVTVHDFKVNR